MLMSLSATRFTIASAWRFLLPWESRYQLVLLLAERGEFAEAAVQGDEAVRIAEIANHPFSLCTAYFGVGDLHVRQGAIDKAISVLEHSLEVCRLWNIPQNLSPGGGGSRLCTMRCCWTS